MDVLSILFSVFSLLLVSLSFLPTACSIQTPPFFGAVRNGGPSSALSVKGTRVALRELASLLLLRLLQPTSFEPTLHWQLLLQFNNSKHFSRHQ